MIKGTIKDYTITTLEELIEPRDNKELKVYIHTYLNLRITGLKWDTKVDYKPSTPNKEKAIDIEVTHQILKHTR